jgi:hypothetical protein
MASLDSTDVQAALRTKLGCTEKATDHYRYTLYDDDGTVLGSTKISLGAKHTIGDVLIGLMARQMRLGTSGNLVGLVKCTKSREECLAIIRSIASQRR